MRPPSCSRTSVLPISQRARRVAGLGSSGRDSGRISTAIRLIPDLHTRAVAHVLWITGNCHRRSSTTGFTLEPTREDHMAEQRRFTNLEAYRGQLTVELLEDAVTREEER